jgi:AraC-like DNA-binding protein
MPGEATDETRVRAVHPALRAYVDAYVGYRHLATEAGRHRGMPSDRLTVIVAFEEPIDLAWYGQEETRRTFWTLASGLHTRAVDIRHGGLQHGLQLSLTPLGCRALLGIPAGEIARELVDLGALLPELDCHDELCAAGWDERFAALDRALLAALDRVDGGRVPHPELDHAWRLVERSHGTMRVADLADAVGWSRRRLSGRFVAEYGVTPKEAARVTRFDHSRRQVALGVPLAEAAMLSGYADQPHLTREWREISGYSPTEYLREEIPFVQDRYADAGADSGP